MKRRAWQTLTVITLTLFFLLASPTAVAGELSRGVSWDTTERDMLTIEGIPEGENREGSVNGEFTHYGFLHFADTPHVTFMTYVFKSGQLVLYRESISAAMQAEDVSMTSLYTEQLMALMEIYGGPILQDKQPAIDAFNAISVNVMTEEGIVVFTGWDLGDGTILYLMYVKTEDDKALYTAYVNEPLLLNEE